MAGPEGMLTTGRSALDAVLASQQVQSAVRLFPAALHQGLAGASSLAQVYLLQLPTDGDVLQSVAALAQDSGVEWAEPDYLAYPAAVPNDPLFPEQWALAQIQAPAAWDVVTGMPAVVIAVLDTGIDLDHPDLAGRLWANPGETPGNGLDDDGNGYVDDVRGWNFIAGTNEVDDDDGHGTQVAGVAAAETNNSTGVAGVCWNCRLMTVKVMQAGGVANYSDVARGVTYAAAKGAEVINLSLGGYANSNTLREAIEAAAGTTMIVAAAGDDGASAPFYPAAYPDVLAVGGTTAADARAAFSNYGDWVDVAAPALAITTTLDGGSYGSASGTSLAAPLAAGLAGLVWSQHPAWSAALVRAQVLHTTDAIGATGLGRGRINAAAAVTAEPHPLLAIAATAIDGDPLGRPTPGSGSALAVTLGNDWLDAVGVTGTLTTADPYVTIVTGTAAFGDIAAGATGTGTPVYSLTVASGAGYNHPIPFTLHLSADQGAYTATLPLTITTRSADQNVGGTIAVDTTWTNDKTYIVISNVGIAPGVTLTIQPGTVVRFNGDYSLNVGGTLIAAGTEGQPIRFMSNTGADWGRIYFDNSGVDATATVSGTYQAGNVLRWVHIESASQGIGCNGATPYLARVTLANGGVICTVGATTLWVWDSTLAGGLTVVGGGEVWRNAVTGGINLSGLATVRENAASGGISTGSDSLVRDNTAGGTITAPGASTVRGNTTSGGGISVGNLATAQENHVTGGSLSAGSSTTVVTNTVHGGGIAIGSGSLAQGNDVEGSTGWGISASGSATLVHNRVVGCANGVSTGGGLVQGNLIANSSGIGLQVGGSTVVSNTLTGNAGNTLVVAAGVPAIHGNNLEANRGTYDLVNNTANPIDATGNWWGITTSAAIEERVYDFLDDFNLGRVTHVPVQAGPVQDAPAYVRAVTVMPTSPVGLETATFDVLFSRPMDQGGPPDVEFYTAKRGTTVEYVTGVAGPNDHRAGTGGYFVDEDRVYVATSRYCLDSSCSENDCVTGKPTGFGFMSLDGTWQTLSLGSYTSAAIDAARNKYFGMADQNGGTGILKIDADDVWHYLPLPPSPYTWIDVIWFDTGGNAYVRTIGQPQQWVCGTDIDVLTPDGEWLPYTGEPYSGAWWSKPEVDQEGNTWSLIMVGWDYWRLRKSFQGWDYPARGGAQWLSAAHYRASYDVDARIFRGDYEVSVMHAWGMDGLAVAPHSIFTFTIDYIGDPDTSTPPTPVVRACASSLTTTLSAQWSVPTTQTLSLYRYAVGTAPGLADVTTWVTTTLTAVERANLNLLPGQTYYLSVKARNNGGIWSAASASNGVVAGAGGCPGVDLTALPTSGMAPLPVAFTATITGTETTRLWSFGDGVTSTLPNPVHTYAAGLYTVTLDVWSPSGWTTAVKGSYITVVPDTVPPAGALVIDAGAAYATETAVLLDVAAGDPSGVDDMRFSNDGVGYSTWVAYAPAFSWTLSTVDGPKTVYAQVRDVPGNIATYTDTIILDTTPPTATVLPLPPFVGSATFTITWAGHDAYAGLDSYDLQFREGDGPWTDWFSSTVQTSAVYTGSHGQTYYFRARARDILGHLGSYAPGDGDSHTTVDLLPPVGSVLVNNDALYANALDVTLNLVAADLSGVTDFQASNDGLVYSAWISFTPAYSWTLAAGDGEKTVYARFRDLVGHESDAVSDTIVLDTVPPTGTVVVNGDAPFTAAPAVTLTLSATDLHGIAGMAFSNDGITFTGWVSYTTTYPWTLLPGDGAKTIHARFRDPAGNVVTASDTIVLDTTPPTTTATPTGLPGDNGWWRSPLQVTLAATDTTSAVDYTTYQVNGGAWLTYTGPFSVTGEGVHTLAYASVDIVGNAEITRSEALPIDTRTPTTTAVISGTPGQAGWYVSSVQVALDAVDDTAGVAAIYYRLDSGGWQPYSAAVVLEDGVYTLDYYAVDLAGNAEPPQGITVSVDTIPPVAAVDYLPPYQQALTFTISWAGDDALSGIASFDLQARMDDGAWGDWLTATTALSSTFAGFDGHTFSFRARAHDAAGNQSEYAAGYGDTTTHVDTARPMGLVAINGGAVDTTGRDVTLVLLANEETQVAFSDDGANFTPWEPFAATRAYQLPAGEGVKTVYVRYCCSLQGGIRAYSDSIMVNTAVPGDYGLSINNDAPLTDRVTVTLTLKAPPGTRQMMLSNSSRFVAAEWEPYAITRTWVLAYYPGVEVYQVYARFRSVDGGIGERYDDIITLDLLEPPPPIDGTPPSGSMAINAGAETTAVPTVTLDLLAWDNPGGVGVYWMYFREWKYDPLVGQWQIVRSSDWLPYADSAAWVLAGGTGTKYVGAWFADGAQNVSNPSYLDSINLVLPGDVISETQVTQYRETFEAGQVVTVTLYVTAGDADLYIWRPGSAGMPDYWSNLPGTATERLVFTAVAGEYLIEVHGYTSSVYTLDIATSGPGGGRQEQAAPMALRWPALLGKPLPAHPLVTTRPGGNELPAEPEYRIFLPLVLRTTP